MHVGLVFRETEFAEMIADIRVEKAWMCHQQAAGPKHAAHFGQGLRVAAVVVLERSPGQHDIERVIRKWNRIGARRQETQVVRQVL